MILFKIDARNEDDLRNALASLCENDCDMNGENGDEYTWQIALSSGYTSNADYLANEILRSSAYKTPKEMFEAFAKEFYRTNDGYYDGYDIEFIEDGNELTVAFSIWAN